MSDRWKDFLTYENASFWESFRASGYVKALYREAAIGVTIPTPDDPSAWFYKATSAKEAVKRLGEMAGERLDYLLVRENEDVRGDLLAVLEGCEDTASYGIIEECLRLFPSNDSVIDRYRYGGNVKMATEKQIAYLARLGRPDFKGTSFEASRLIDQLKGGKKK